MVIKDGCDKVLNDLQSLVVRYESLGTQSKRTWDRMKWSNDDVAEIRARLTSNVAVLTAFISTSQITVEAKLDKLIEEFHQGRRERSIISLQSVDSLSADDRTLWRSIRKELEDIGIDLAAFEANRTFILGWLARAVETGAFEEQRAHDAVRPNGDNNEQESRSNERDNEHGNGPQIIRQNGDSGEQEPRSNERDNEHSNGPQITRSGIEAFYQIPEDPSLISQISSQSAHSVQDSFPRPPQVVTRIIEKWPKTPMTRGAAFLAAISRPRQRFYTAVQKNDVAKVLKILQDEASFQLLDPYTLSWALWITCQRGYDDHLAAGLIAKGANVNTNMVNTNMEGGTPLWYSAAMGSCSTIRLLVENGAKVNFEGRLRPFFPRHPAKACDFAARAALGRDDVVVLRLLLSYGVNVHARYYLQESAFTDRKYSDDLNLIQEASALGAVAAIEVLLEYGADIDAVSPNRGTALMLALTEGRDDAARLLLDKGANPNLQSLPHEAFQTRGLFQIRYRSPLEAAIVSRIPAMLNLLLERGAIPDLSTLRYVDEVIYSKRQIYPNAREDSDTIRKMIGDTLEAGRPLRVLEAERQLSAHPAIPQHARS